MERYCSEGRLELHYVGACIYLPTLCNPMASTKRDQILHLIEKTRVLRLQDVETLGISRTYLKVHSSLISSINPCNTRSWKLTIPSTCPLLMTGARMIPKRSKRRAQ